MSKRRLLTYIGCGVILFTSYMNCSKSGFNTVDIESPVQPSMAPPSENTPSNPEYATADSSGKIIAFQDLKFRFRVPDGGVGLMTATNLPPWLSVDQATRELYGVPTEILDYTGITVSFPGVTHGPYMISVVGDPLKTHQWHLTNTGQSTFSGRAGVTGEDIHLSQTIASRLLGQGIRIAISDTGVYENHRGLSPALIAGASRNYFNDYASSFTWAGSATPGTSSNGNAHGTAVAGLAAQRGWLGIGGRGVAPLAQLAGFLFLPAQDHLTSTGYYSIALHDQYAGDFDIFNYSWGDSQCAFYDIDSTYKAKIKAGANLRGGKGAIFVKAAGNEFWGYSEDCHSSASSSAWYLGNAGFSEESTTPYTIVVSALNAKGKSSSYSSPGPNLWISAPGGEYGWSKPTTSEETALSPALLTTDFPICNAGMKAASVANNDFDAGMTPNTNCEHTATMNGTSGAAPIVSGAVALLLSANPDLSWRDVKHILASTAEKNDPNRGPTNHPDSSSNLTNHVFEQGWVTNAAGYHFHNWYGFGRVNVDLAVQMAKNYNSPLGTMKETNSGSTWKYSSGALNVSVPAGSSTGVSRTLTVSESYFIEGVQVRLSAKNCIGNLGVELTSPAGTKSILMNINTFLLDTEIAGHTFLTNAFYGENSAGTWTLKLIGGKAGCTTTWTSWDLNVIGH